MFNSEKALKKWGPLLESADCPPIKDQYRKAVTAVMLESQEEALKTERAQRQFITEAADTVAGNVQNFDPVLIALVRRAMPNLIAYDVAGVQPMNAPTGLVFAMKSLYVNDKGTLNSPPVEAWAGNNGSADAPDTAFGGDGTGAGMTTAAAEVLDDTTFSTMGFTIDKTTVTAKTRALKAGYTMELAQDLKAVHGLDAEGELANILSAEILGETNRELIAQIGSQAKAWATSYGSPSGVYDIMNSDEVLGARWGAERFKALAFEIEKVCNAIAIDTRRGKGNFIIVSSNVASALVASGKLDYSPALSTNLEVDATGNTFAGVLNGKIKVYVDPYASGDTVIVGYRGSNPYDAGIFYCPYVPLTMVKAIGEQDFQPRIGFKTRYGLVSNPFYGNGAELASAGTNGYFRKFTVAGI